MEHVGISIRTNNIDTVTTFPPIQKPDQSIFDNIREAVFRSMNFTSKFCKATSWIN